MAFFVSSSVPCTSLGVAEAGLIGAASVAGENSHTVGLTKIA